MQTFAVTMLGSIFENNDKIRFTFAVYPYLLFDIFFAFLEDKRYKKKFNIAFDEMAGNGKSGKVINEALDKSSNPFLMLAYGNIYSTAFVFSYLKKNYPLLLKMYNNYIKLDQCKDEYVTKKIKRNRKFILSTSQTKQKVDSICFVAMHFLKELEL